MGRPHRFVLPLTAAAALAAAFTVSAADPAGDDAEQKGPELHWVEGPKKVSLGGALAEVELPESVVFLEKEDTQKLLEHWGNVTSGSELGLIAPKAEGQDWVIVFDYDDSGYVKDDDKDIDADAILQSLKEGTEQSNAERKKRGSTALHVTGWAEPPHYDEKTHNLTWATLDRTDEGHVGVNYNVRVLGRSGVMSVTLIEDPDKLAASKPAVEQVLKAFHFKQGKSYAEWVPGDKVAEYGLAGLVAAGAGVAAVKLGLFGLLAKFWKLALVALAGMGAGIAKGWRSFLGLFKKKEGNRAAGDFRAPPGPGEAP